MKTEKVLTKKPFVYRSFRLSHWDVEAWQASATKLEISQSEFLRQALRDKAREVLRGHGERRGETQKLGVDDLGKCLSSEVGSVIADVGTAKKTKE